MLIGRNYSLFNRRKIESELRIFVKFSNVTVTELAQYIRGDTNTLLGLFVCELNLPAWLLLRSLLSGASCNYHLSADPNMEMRSRHTTPITSLQRTAAVRREGI